MFSLFFSLFFHFSVFPFVSFFSFFHFFIFSFFIFSFFFNKFFLFLLSYFSVFPFSFIILFSFLPPLPLLGPSRPHPFPSLKHRFFPSKILFLKARFWVREEERRKKNAPTETGPLPQSHAQEQFVICVRGNPFLRQGPRTRTTFSAVG